MKFPRILRRPFRPQVRRGRCLPSYVESLETRVLLSAGDLDPTFGNGGLVTTNNEINRNEAAKAVAIQDDGKIVVAGDIQIGIGVDTAFALYRYNPDGTLDSSFGNNGQVVMDFSESGDDGATAVVIQDDGNLCELSVIRLQWRGFLKEPASE